MLTRKRIIIALGLMALFVLLNAVYIIDERERAVVLRFGRIVKNDVKPGIHLKIPMIERLIKMDGRVLTLTANAQRYFTIEQKSLIVDSYLKWRIYDVNQFYQRTMGNLNRANQILASRVEDGLRNKFGERTLKEVVSGERDDLLRSITDEVNQVALEELGIEVLDVRVKRIDLPPEVSDSVFGRMRSEREHQAREHRSRGKADGVRIMAEADKDRLITISKAYRKAEILKGEADAISASTYSKAFQRFPDFYAFYRQLQAFERSFASGDGSLLIIEPNGQLFKRLEDGY